MTTTPRRVDAGPLLVLAGALLLFVSLFLPWYEPSLEAWQTFELVDLLLALGALAAVLTALGMLADFPGAPDARLLPWLSLVPFVLVVATLLDRPPIVGDGHRDVGLWLALAGSALMAAGTALAFARVSVAFDVAARERRRRVAAVDTRAPEAEAAPPDPPIAGKPLFGTPEAEPTEPMPPGTEEADRR